MTAPTASPRPTAHLPFMQHGAALHRAGQREQALLQFEQARALAPGDVDAASACATLLHELQRPAAARQALQAVRPALLQTADGCANLAIAAELCGQAAEAADCYAQAIALDPDNLRARNNLGLLHARQGQWNAALVHARHALDGAPHEPVLWCQVADMLTGARRHGEAFALIERGLQTWPGALPFAMRRAALLAFSGQTVVAQGLLDAIDAAQTHAIGTAADGAPALAAPAPAGSGTAPTALQQFIALAAPLPALDRSAGTQPPPRPDARALFIHQALAAWQAGDAVASAGLTEAIRALLEANAPPVDGRYWRAWAPQIASLPLSPREQLQCQSLVTAHLKSGLSPATGHTPFRPRPRDASEPVHIGLLLPGLTDAARNTALAHRLAAHHGRGVVFHAYACGHRPAAEFSPDIQLLAQTTEATGGNFVEIAHMDDAEATARLRLDRLDLLIDTAPGATWSRDAIFARRAAPLQSRAHPWIEGLATAGLVDTDGHDAFALPVDEAQDLAPTDLRRQEDRWREMAERARMG